MKLIVNSCDGAYNSLDVRFTKHCDNNCSFCIEKKGIKSFGKTNVDKLIESTIKSGIKEILILGGEPFLYPNELYEYVYRIRNEVDKIYITTSLPNTFNTESIYCDNILELIDGLNISIQNPISFEFNNKALKASSKHNRLSILRKLNIKYANKIRTSINLVKGEIDNMYDLKLAIFSLEQLGCKFIKINELQHSDLYVSYERDINPDIWLKSPYSHGCNIYIEFPMAKAKILLKRSCFLVEKSCKASLSDLIKSLISLIYSKKNNFAVLYENGLITKGWINENYN